MRILNGGIEGYVGAWTQICFYDKYESDVNIAKSIDEACMSCPVIKMCYDSGVENEEYGVWGGVYLNAGPINRIS
jgi:hypothetical protein